MGEEVTVTRADRECAVHEFTKLRFCQVTWSAQDTMAWCLYRETGEQTHFPERVWWDVAELARAIARVRIAAAREERERCAALAAACAREVKRLGGPVEAVMALEDVGEEILGEHNTKDCTDG